MITVPHETEKIVAQNVRNKVPHGHIHYFDTKTLDYLKNKGYHLSFEKTLSPLLIIPRVIAEGFKKPNTKLPFKLYNLFTPVFKKLFGIKTANCLTNLDSKMTQLFGFYQGITFIIEKNDQLKKDTLHEIKAENFTGIKVEEYQLS